MASAGFLMASFKERASHLFLRGTDVCTDGNNCQPVAQRQEMVSGTLALLHDLSEAAFHVSRALAPKGNEVL